MERDAGTMPASLSFASTPRYITSTVLDLADSQRPCMP